LPSLSHCGLQPEPLRYTYPYRIKPDFLRQITFTRL
jgi:hypothetical protein